MVQTSLLTAPISSSSSGSNGAASASPTKFQAAAPSSDASSCPPAASIPLNEVAFGTLAYQEIRPTSDDENLFYRTLVEQQSEFEQMNFYKIVPKEISPSHLVAERACLASVEGIALIEATKPLMQDNKESLSTLLDLADECGCSTMVGCVDKDKADFTTIVRSYISVGFTPSTFISLPGFMLLVREL